MKKKNIIFISIICIIVLSIIVSIFFVMNKKDKESVNVESLTISDIDSKVDVDNGDEDIDWSEYETKEIKLDNSLNITSKGIYKLTGNISNGLITIDTTDNVKLVLDNVSITNKNGPCIYIKDAEDVVIELIGSNTLIDGDNYSSDYEDIDSVIFSSSDLTFMGNGTLNVNAKYGDGIVSKDDLKFVNGTYIIDSVDDGIRGKDSVYIKDGKYEINSKGDGIKSTKDDDNKKGFIKIENGTFDITSTLDGIQATNKLIIDNGVFNIITGGGSGNESTSEDWGMWREKGNQKSNNEESAKGLKASSNIIINNGKFNFDTSDDSIHSNNYLGISNGNITISSGDDGLHADKEVIIDGGDVTINKSYEGLEGSKVTINDGNINIVASDDGINIAGGNDSSSLNRPGENKYIIDEDNKDNILIINNGSIVVDSKGDGIDINGSGYINGGSIIVKGPTDNGNAALDYDLLFNVSGGELIALGSTGMALGASDVSKQHSVMINFTNSYESNTKITIVDTNNKEIMSYEADKSFSSVVYSSNKLKKNETYIIKINGDKYDEFKITDINTTLGQVNKNNPGRQNGMPGGNPRGDKPRMR